MEDPGWAAPALFAQLQEAISARLRDVEQLEEGARQNHARSIADHREALEKLSEARDRLSERDEAVYLREEAVTAREKELEQLKADCEAAFAAREQKLNAQYAALSAREQELNAQYAAQNEDLDKRMQDVMARNDAIYRRAKEIDERIEELTRLTANLEKISKEVASLQERVNDSRSHTHYVRKLVGKLHETKLLKPAASWVPFEEEENAGAAPLDDFWGHGLNAGVPRPASPGHIPDLVEDPLPPPSTQANPATATQPAGDPRSLNTKLGDGAPAVVSHQPIGHHTHRLQSGGSTAGGQAEVAEQGAAGAPAAPGRQPGEAAEKRSPGRQAKARDTARRPVPENGPSVAQNIRRDAKQSNTPATEAQQAGPVGHSARASPVHHTEHGVWTEEPLQKRSENKAASDHIADVPNEEWADPPAWEMDEACIDTAVLNRGAQGSRGVWPFPPEEQQPGGSRQPGGNGQPGGVAGSTGKKRSRSKGRKKERSSFSGADDAQIADKRQHPKSRFKPQVDMCNMRTRGLAHSREAFAGNALGQQAQPMPAGVPDFTGRDIRQAVGRGMRGRPLIGARGRVLERMRQGKKPGLAETDGIDAAVEQLREVMSGGAHNGPDPCTAADVTASGATSRDESGKQS